MPFIGAINFRGMMFLQRGGIAVKRCRIILISFALFISVTAQDIHKQSVKGKVADSLTSAPLSFATIQVFSHPSGKIAAENISSEQVDFEIGVRPGNYYVLVSFMGYRNYTSTVFNISMEKISVNIDRILLSSKTADLEEVIVQAETSSMHLALDKKIFNVGQDLANAGSTALDILSNIPLLSVDPEGSVKLRGSDNVRILIDGKPSGLVSFKGASGLKQLQSSMIDRVEIIRFLFSSIT